MFHLWFYIGQEFRTELAPVQRSPKQQLNVSIRLEQNIQEKMIHSDQKQVMKLHVIQGSSYGKKLRKTAGL